MVRRSRTSTTGSSNLISLSAPAQRDWASAAVPLHRVCSDERPRGSRADGHPPSAHSASASRREQEGLKLSWLSIGAKT